MPRQQRDIFATHAQRWHGQVQHVEAVVKVFAKRPLSHRLAQVAVSGGDDAHIHLPRAFCADTGHFTLLQYPQQTDLGVEGHVANFIQEDGAPIRQFELACRPATGSAGEGAFDVAEQLALHQVPWDRTAVHCHKRALVPVAAIVDRLGEQFFAGAAFTEDQSGGVAAAGNTPQVQRVLDRPRTALDGVEGVAGLGADDTPGDFADAAVFAQ